MTVYLQFYFQEPKSIRITVTDANISKSDFIKKGFVFKLSSVIIKPYTLFVVGEFSFALSVVIVCF